MNEGKRVYGCISTFESLVLKGNVILDITSEFIEKVIKPLGMENQLEIGYDGTKIRPKSYKLNAKSLEKVRGIFSEGKIESMGIHYYDNNTDQVAINFRSYSNSSEYIDASIIDFSIDDYLYENIPGYVQKACIDIIQKLTSSINSVGGFITLDRLALSCASSPYEIYMRRAYPWASKEFDKYYRGYQWGNFLSKRHVEMLGGIDKVLKEAPVYKSIRLDDGGAFLQLTEDINSFTDDDLRHLKDFLFPILPPKTGNAFLSEYQHLRIVPEIDDTSIIDINKNEMANSYNSADIEFINDSVNIDEEDISSGYEKLFEIPVPININEDIEYSDIEIVYHISNQLDSMQEEMVRNDVAGWKEDYINEDKGAQGVHYVGEIVFDHDEATVSLRVDMGSSPIKPFVSLVTLMHNSLFACTSISKIDII